MKILEKIKSSFLFQLQKIERKKWDWNLLQKNPLMILFLLVLLWDKSAKILSVFLIKRKSHFMSAVEMQIILSFTDNFSH